MAIYPKNETKWQKELIRDVAKQFELDVRVVREIVYYPLLFVKNRMRNDNSEVPIRLRNLGAFDLRTTKGKLNKAAERVVTYVHHAELIWPVAKDYMGQPFESKGDFVEKVKLAFTEGRFGHLRKLEPYLLEVM